MLGEEKKPRRSFEAAASSGSSALRSGRYAPGEKVDRFLRLAAGGAIQAVETALAFAADVAAGNHLLDQGQLAVGRLERIARRQRLGEAGIDVRHQVQPDQIDEPEHARLRNTQMTSDGRIRFLDGNAGIQGLDDPDLQPVHAPSGWR